MANRRLNQFMYSFRRMPVYLDIKIPIGASGAVGTIVGPGIKSVTRLKAGVYDIQLSDNYNKFLGLDVAFEDPITGASIADGSFVAATLYQITAVGTTGWAAVGVPAGITPAVGLAFVATGVGGAGSGTVKAVGNSGITAVELAGDPNLELTNSNQAANGGGHIIIQCLNATTQTDPSNGATLLLGIYLDNSSMNF